MRLLAAHGRGDGQLGRPRRRPTTGGVILAFETARQLGSGASSPRRSGDDGTRREFRRGFHIEPGERVLLVDDILTTGGSLLAMLPAVEAMGGEIVECVVLVDRSGGRATLTLADDRAAPTRSASLWQLDLPTYEPGAGDLPALRRRDAAVRARQHRAPAPIGGGAAGGQPRRASDAS